MSYRTNALGYIEKTEASSDTIKASTYSSAARDKLQNPDLGMIVFDPDSASLLYWNGSNWLALNQASTRMIQTCVGADTVDSAIDVVVCDATAGPFTLTLAPASAYYGRTIAIVKVDGTGNVVTVRTQGSDTIGDNSITQVLLSGQNSVISLMSAVLGCWYVV